MQYMSFSLGSSQYLGAAVSSCGPAALCSASFAGCNAVATLASASSTSARAKRWYTALHTCVVCCLHHLTCWYVIRRAQQKVKTVQRTLCCWLVVTVAGLGRYTLPCCPCNNDLTFVTEGTANLAWDVRIATCGEHPISLFACIARRKREAEFRGKFATDVASADTTPGSEVL